MILFLVKISSHDIKKRFNNRINRLNVSIVSNY
ncbi:hypothetical protein EMIT0P228_80127 [Pseudomonas brassicacearum]